MNVIKNKFDDVFLFFVMCLMILIEYGKETIGYIQTLYFALGLY